MRDRTRRINNNSFDVSHNNPDSVASQGGGRGENRRQSVSQLGHSFNALTHAVSVSLSSTAPATASELLGQSSLCLSLSLLLPLPARTFCGRLYIIHMSRQQCHSPSLFLSVGMPGGIYLHFKQPSALS